MNNDKFLKELEKFTEQKQYPPRIKIFSPQSTTKEFFYIKSGLLKQYYKIKNKEHVFRLLETGEFCESINFISGKVNNFEFIESITEVQILRFNYEEIEPFIKNNILISNLLLDILEKYIINQESRVIEFLSLNPKQRYENFIKTNFEKIGKFPDKDIASFLGITKESMSRFRNRKS